MQTRKDYIAISNILSDYQGAMEADEYYQMVVDFGKMMKSDNVRFDLSRFMIACGIDIQELVSHAMATPKPASQHVALVQDVEEGWGKAY